MIDVYLVVVPPGGGEADYEMYMTLPAVPSPGDYIAVSRGQDIGVVSLIVKRTWWHLRDGGPEDPKAGLVHKIEIECYPARGAGYDSDQHKRVLAMYEAQGKEPPSFESTNY